MKSKYVAQCCTICSIDIDDHPDAVFYGVVWQAAGACDVLILTRHEETKAKCSKFLCHTCIRAVENAVVTSDPVVF